MNVFPRQIARQIVVIQRMFCQDNVAAPTPPTEMDEVRRQLETTHQQLMAQLQELNTKTQVMSHLILFPF